MRKILLLVSCFFALAPGPAADLEVTDIQVSGTTHSPWVVKVTIKNMGSADAIGAVCVDLFVDLPAAPEIGDMSDESECIGHLNAEEVQTLVFQTDAEPESWWDALIDTQDEFWEPNEANNIYSEFIR